MKLTIIESPFAGDLARNCEYLKRAVLDSISRGETPFASHGFFPQFLDDSNPQERNTGLILGYNFWEHAERVAFYIDYDMSPGMEAARRVYASLQDNNPDLVYALRRIGLNA